MATRRPQRRRPQEEAPLAAENGIPEGWVLSVLPDVVEINPPKPAATEVDLDEPVTFVPMGAVDERAGTIARPEVRPFSTVRKGYTAFTDGDVIMAKITPCMENGKAAIARNLVNGLGFGSTEFHVFRSHGAVLPEYVYHYLRQASFRQAAEGEMTGSVGQKRVPRGFLESARLPVPPLAEQMRIVALLEQLLARLDSCRDRLERIPGLLSRFRQAVLAAACSGKILGTRAGESRHSWRTMTLASLAETVTSGSRGWARYYAVDGAIFIRSEDINTDQLILGRATHVRPPTGSEGTRTRVKKGDLLITITGANVGRCALVDKEMGEAYVSQHVGLVRLKNPDHAPFLHLWITSPRHGRTYLLNAAYGGGKPGLNLSNIRSMPIMMPPLDAQQEIVRRVALIVRSAEATEQRIIVATKSILGLRNSVLTRAFCGELVPTEAELAAREKRSYESADKLLRRLSIGRSST